MRNPNVYKTLVSWRFVCCIFAALGVIVYLFHFGGIIPFLNLVEWVMELDDIFHSSEKSLRQM